MAQMGAQLTRMCECSLQVDELVEVQPGYLAGRSYEKASKTLVREGSGGHGHSEVAVHARQVFGTRDELRCFPSSAAVGVRPCQLIHR